MGVMSLCSSNLSCQDLQASPNRVMRVISATSGLHLTPIFTPADRLPFAKKWCKDRGKLARLNAQRKAVWLCHRWWSGLQRPVRRGTCLC